jgi:DNA-binding CsgD family transcriptional regulator
MERITERELEEAADRLLMDENKYQGSDWNTKGDYPFYTENAIRLKMKRDRRYLPELAEQGMLTGFADLHGSKLEEVKSLLLEISGYSGFTEFETFLLGLLIMGMSRQEICKTIKMEPRTLFNKIKRLRKKLNDTVTQDFWLSLRKPSLYHRPSICCSPGLELCKTDTGRCPFGKTASPR